MKIFVCDDELQIMTDIVKQIKSRCPHCSVEGFVSGNALLTAIDEVGCDVLFLDIDMPEISGLEVARVLKHNAKRPYLIFVTSHDELVYDSFQFHPFGFVRKNYFNEEIGKILIDCEAELKSQQKHFNFQAEGQQVCLKLTDITYFESEGNYLKVFTKGDHYRFRSTLSAVQNALESSGFIRVHKGFLVNQEAVKILSASQVLLLDGSAIPVGKNYMEASKNQLMRYMRS